MGTNKEQKEIIIKIFPDLDDCEIDIIAQIYRWQGKKYRKRTRYRLTITLKKYSKKAILNRLTPGYVKKNTLIERGYISEKEMASSRKEKQLTLKQKGEFVAYLMIYKGYFTDYFKEFNVNDKRVFVPLFKVFSKFIIDCYPEGYLATMSDKDLITVIKSLLYDGILYYMKQSNVVSYYQEKVSFKEWTSSLPISTISPINALHIGLEKVGLDEKEIAKLTLDLVERNFLSTSKFDLAADDKILKDMCSQDGLNTISDAIYFGCLILGFEAEIDMKDLIKNIPFKKGGDKPSFPNIKLKNTRITQMRVEAYCPDMDTCKIITNTKDIIQGKCKRAFKWMK